MVEPALPSEVMEKLDAYWETVRPKVMQRLGADMECADVAAGLDRFYQSMRWEFEESWRIHQPGAEFRYGLLDADLQNMGMRLNMAYVAQSRHQVEIVGCDKHQADKALGSAIGMVVKEFAQLSGHTPVFPKVGPATAVGMPMDPRLLSTPDKYRS